MWPESLVPFPDLSSPGCQPTLLSGRGPLPVLVPTIAGIPGQAPRAGLSPFAAGPGATPQADATSSMRAPTRGALPTLLARVLPPLKPPDHDAGAGGGSSLVLMNAQHQPLPARAHPSPRAEGKIHRARGCSWLPRATSRGSLASWEGQRWLWGH